MIVVTLIVVVVGASSTAYYVLVLSPASTSTSQSSTHVQTSRSSSTAAGPSGLITFSGSYNFSLHLGPTGELVYSNNTVRVYNSVQVASGTFNFWINPINYSGGGSGQGTMTVTTSGFCSGRTSFPYTFKILDATHFPGQNITVYVGTPAPANFTVAVTCTATPSQATANTFAYLSTFPIEFVFASAPVTVSQHLSGNTTSWYTVHSP